MKDHAILYVPVSQGNNSYIVPSWRQLFREILERTLWFSQNGISVLRYEDGPIKGAFPFFLTIGLNAVNEEVKNRCQIISFWDDLHYFNEASRRNRHRLFETATALLLTYPEHFFFYDEYSCYREKVFSFPWFSAFETKLADDAWYNRPGKLLLSGRISDSYPLRKSLASLVSQDAILAPQVEILRHPGYNERQKQLGAILDIDYYNYLSLFKGSVATSGESAVFPIDYVVAKYYEIPAAGDLLVCQPIPYLQERGFVNGKNCIYLDLTQPIEHLRDICNNIESYYSIAKSGQILIRQKHSIAQRLVDLASIIHKLNEIVQS